MRFTLTINLHGDAFGDNIDNELRRCLAKVANTPGAFEGPEDGSILDGNGNTVGQWEITEVIPPTELEDLTLQFADLLNSDAGRRRKLKDLVLLHMEVKTMIGDSEDTDAEALLNRIWEAMIAL